MHEQATISAFTAQAEGFNASAAANNAAVLDAIVVADHLADADQPAFAWSQELERLRDPSHWLSLTLDRARALAAAAGLTVERELIVGLALDFDDWLARGRADPGAQTLVERALAARPASADCFTVQTAEDGGRTLRLRVWVALLRKR